MSPEQILQVCHRAGKVGEVSHEEFAAFVIPMVSRKRTDNGWQNVETPYMPVDGKIAMACEDHRRQNARLDFAQPVLIQDTDEKVTMLVTITSSVYGARHGIATSSKNPNDGERASAENQNPYEVAETSAVGRALSFFGYGIFPGSDIASADDMRRARAAAESSSGSSGGSNGNGSRENRQPVSQQQKAKMLELTGHVYQLQGEQSVAKLDELFNEQFRTTAAAGTYAQGQAVLAKLLAALKEKSK